MEAVKRTWRTLCVLCLAPLVGVSCGDPSLSAGVERPSTPSPTGEPVYYFAPVKPVLLSDRGPRCATVWVGGVVELRGCSDFKHLPQVMMSEAASGLFVLMTNGGDTITFFPDRSVRVLTTSKHYVVAQTSADADVTEVKFTVASAAGFHRCAMDRWMLAHCR